MNSDQFRQEIHEYVDNVYNTFLEKREVLVELLMLFRNVCEKNNIQYYLCFGSMIGAVRDQGLIPWDSDIDVCIKVTDAEKLCAALKKDLPEGYYYKSVFEDTEYSLFMTRIYKDGYDTSAYNLDIYYVFGGPDDMNACSALAKEIKKLHYARHTKYQVPKRENYYSKYSYILKRIRHMKYAFTSYKSTYKKYMKYIHQYDMEKSKYVILLNDTHAIPREAFESPVTVNMLGLEWPIPCGYDRILTDDYKDYMKYYPIKNRFDEMVRGYKTLTGTRDKK